MVFPELSFRTRNFFMSDGEEEGRVFGTGEKKENLQVPCEEKTSDIHNSCWTLLEPDEPNDHRLLESRSLTA